MARTAEPTAAPASSARIWFVLVTVYVVWSTTFIGIKVTNETMPAMLAGGVRFLIAGAVLLPIALTHGDRRGDRPGSREWRGAAIVGLLLIFCGNGGIVWAERTIPSGLAGLAIATVPLWIATIDRVALGKRQPRVAVVGLVVGFMGAVLLVGGSALEGDIDVGGLLIALAAAASWAVGSVYQRHARLPKRAFVGAGMQMLIASAAFFAAGALAGEIGLIDSSAFSRASVLALAYLIVVGSWIGFTSYLWLLRNTRISLVATYAYVTPVGAVILGILLLDEPLTASTLVAGGMIVLAVALIVSSGGASATEEPIPAQLD